MVGMQARMQARRAPAHGEASLTGGDRLVLRGGARGAPGGTLPAASCMGSRGTRRHCCALQHVDCIA